MQSICNLYAIYMQSICSKLSKLWRFEAQNRKVYAIYMQSICNLYAMYMQSICNLYAKPVPLAPKP